MGFEVDDFDPIEHSGWSVNLIGVARDLDDVLHHLTFDPTLIPRWAPTGDSSTSSGQTPLGSQPTELEGVRFKAPAADGEETAAGGREL